MSGDGVVVLAAQRVRGACGRASKPQGGLT